jgi:hypothetical protein
VKSTQKPFQHFSYREFKRQGSRSSSASGIVETRNAKSPIFGILATGISKDKGATLPLHRESPKPEMRKAPKSHFDIPTTGISKDKVVALPLHREFLKHEMQKVFILGHPPWKKQLMNIEQVVETSAQAMNVRYGGSGRQSAQDHPVCRTILKNNHADLMSSTDQKSLHTLS